MQDCIAFANTYNKWIEQALREGNLTREEQWTKSLAVGSRRFVDGMKRKLGQRAKYRSVDKTSTAFQLHEDLIEPYSGDFDTEIEGLSIGNGYGLETSQQITECCAGDPAEQQKPDM